MPARSGSESESDREREGKMIPGAYKLSDMETRKRKMARANKIGDFFFLFTGPHKYLERGRLTCGFF